MNDNKLLAIIFVIAWVTMGAVFIFTPTSEGEKVKLEKEKTKQLIIQYKIDSINSIKKEVK